MTMDDIPMMAHLGRAGYEAIRAQEKSAAAALATRWGVEAVGRQYPDRVTRSNGHTFMHPGKWYLVRNGSRVRATAAQARMLNATGVAHGVSAVGPIPANLE